MTRPMVRKVGPWWWIFLGRTSWAIGDRYSTNARAHDAAVRLAAKGALR